VHRQPGPVSPHGSLHGQFSRRRIVADRGASDHGGSGGTAFAWRPESRAGQSLPECPSPDWQSPGMAAFHPRPGPCPGSWPDAVLPTRPIRSGRAWRTSATRITRRFRTHPGSGRPTGRLCTTRPPSGNVANPLTVRADRPRSGALAPPGQHQQRQNHRQRQPRRQQSQRGDPGHDIVVPALQPDPTAA
jgi:hypothetical protein